MIKVGIYGPSAIDSAIRKQLLRLLLRHPDVDLRGVATPTGNAMPLAELYPVFSGETELRLERTIDLENLDVLFVIDEENLTDEIKDKNASDEDFRLIVLGDTRDLLAEPGTLEYGLPEYNRKALVRGATAAFNPSAGAMIMELALFPLAKFGLLQGDISITVAAGKVDPAAAAAEATALLRRVQPSFAGQIHAKVLPEPPFRRIDLEAELHTPISLEEIVRLYNDSYSDHNFVYVIPGTGTIAEDLRGSNKCLIRLHKDGDVLHINASIDAMTRGITGNAVHIMNLLFGLYERTGLSI